MPWALQTLLLTVLCCWSMVAKGDTRVGDVESLRSALAQGMVDEVYFPDHAEYQNASTAFNLRLQYKPVAIAYPRSTEEVSNIVKTCVRLGIPGQTGTVLTKYLVLTAAGLQRRHVPAAIHMQATVSVAKTGTWLLTCLTSTR